MGAVFTSSTLGRARLSRISTPRRPTRSPGRVRPLPRIVRTIFAQPDHASALAQRRKVTDGLRPRFPRAAALLEDATEDILAYRHLPLEHQRQLHSTNPLERLNKEIKRRSNVVGIFPNPAAVIRLVGDSAGAGR